MAGLRTDAPVLAENLLVVVQRGAPAVLVATLVAAVFCGLGDLVVVTLWPYQWKLRLIPTFLAVLWINFWSLVGFARAIARRPRPFELGLTGLRKSHVLGVTIGTASEMQLAGNVLPDTSSSALSGLVIVGVALVTAWLVSVKQLEYVLALSSDTLAESDNERKAFQLLSGRGALFAAVPLALFVLWTATLLPRRGILEALAPFGVRLPGPEFMGALFVATAWTGAALSAAFVAVAKGSSLGAQEEAQGA